MITLEPLLAKGNASLHLSRRGHGIATNSTLISPRLTHVYLQSRTANGDSSRKESELPFPELPPVQEEDDGKEVHPGSGTPPEPNNPLPSDLPSNHPGKEEEEAPKDPPEIDPTIPMVPDQPLQFPQEIPPPDQENPLPIPSEFPERSAPDEWQPPNPQEWRSL